MRRIIILMFIGLMLCGCGDDIPRDTRARWELLANAPFIEDGDTYVWEVTGKYFRTIKKFGYIEVLLAIEDLPEAKEGKWDFIINPTDEMVFYHAENGYIMRFHPTDVFIRVGEALIYTKKGKLCE